VRYGITDITYNITYNIADVMGVSEVLLCPYRCLEYKKAQQSLTYPRDAV